jgi:hypothetical protein
LDPSTQSAADADEHKRAAETAELLTRVSTGAGAVSLNPANASFAARKSSGGFPPVWRLAQALVRRSRVRDCVAIDRSRAVGAAHEPDWYDR